MDPFTRHRLRTAVSDGQPIAAADAALLLDALDRAVAVPPEFVVRVARSGGTVDRWEASHPILRLAPHAAHPADALALASVELRRALAQHDWPDDIERPFVARNVGRAVADAIVAAAPAGAPVDALRWALGELDERTSELDTLRTERLLHERAHAGDADARARLRDRRVAELTAAGVRASDREWSDDGFGPADTVGLSLPCLVLALAAERRESFAGWRFAPDRAWHALEHRVAPRPLSRYERAVVTPLRVADAAELVLRRLGPNVPRGRTVRDYLEFDGLVRRELPGADVSRIDQRLSAAWVPLPTDAIRLLCAGTADEHLSLDELATSPGRFGPYAGWWRLVWVTDDPGEADW